MDEGDRCVSELREQWCSRLWGRKKENTAGVGKAKVDTPEAKGVGDQAIHLFSVTERWGGNWPSKDVIQSAVI